MRMGETFDPVIVLCCTATLNRHDEMEQHLALLLRSNLREFDGKETHVYRIFGDGWRWTYIKSRIQLKAIP
jgi:hypothetical protein